MDALIVVDMQNAFVDMTGDDGPRVLGEVNRLVEAAADEGRPVFLTRDVAPFDLPPGDPDGRAALHAGLSRRGAVVEKGPGKQGGFSGFVLVPEPGPPKTVGTGGLGPLLEGLRESGADSVTVVGIALDVCVAATARDAVRLGYPATVVVAATAPTPDGDVTGAVERLRAAGIDVLD